MLKASVPSRIIIVVAVLGMLAGLTGSLAAGATTTTPAASKPPTAAQIREAIARAEKSSGLWATVDICSPPSQKDMFGIRGQIPALGFAATVQMRITPQYYSVKTGTFKPVPAQPHKPSPTTTLAPVSITTGYEQEGVSFKITPPAVLNATITFTWKLGSKVLATTTRTTRTGVVGVQHASPADFSAADCRIGS
jgi:hypothetical protein